MSFEATPFSVPTSSGLIDLAGVRADFPILAHVPHYLDSAATSQTPTAVIEAQSQWYTTVNAAAHRGVHRLATGATAAIEEARARVAAWLGVASPECVVFTHGTTGALNTVARGIAPTLGPGDQILLTELEHHANLVPWQLVARATGAELRFVPIDDDGQLDQARFQALLTSRTRVLSLALVSNVLGTINPVAAMADLAHRHGALVVVDAAQAAGHLPLDLTTIGADLLALSAHKAYGPLGLGILAGTGAALERLVPSEGGGHMISAVTLDGATWADLPARLEPGTMDGAAVCAFAAALDWLADIGLDRVHAHEQALTATLLERLGSLGRLRILGPLTPSARGSLVSFVDDRVHPHDLAQLLDQCGVAVRAGHHCAQPLHRRLGIPASTRASLAVHNGADDVDALIDGILMARRFLA